MICPKCGIRRSQVVLETRRSPEGIYRRRSCGECAKVYVTVESVTELRSLPAELNRRVRPRPEHQPQPQGRPSFDAMAAFNGRIK